MRKVSIEGKNILVDGKPVCFRSGSMHYFRIHPDYWKDRIIKLKQCGLNTLETYIPWNFHEPEEGKFEFEGWKDFTRYIRMAQELGLYVIVRPGPYICSEWDFGGLPCWLLRKPGLKIRTSEPSYIAAVDHYFSVLLPKLKELQWDNGGPIVMMQIENEYGTIANDTTYLKHLYDFFRESGITVPLFISDLGSPFAMNCGAIPETLLTVNCPSHPGRYLDAVQGIRPNTPEFIMELWSGVSHRWNAPYLRHSVKDVARDVREMLERGNSFNFYMFHGGTSFGFMPGGNMPDGHYEPHLNSYDVDALLDEAGNPTEKYFAVQKLIHEYCPDAEIGTPVSSKLKAFPPVQFTESAELFRQLSNLSEKHESLVPKTMEQFGQYHGFIFYRTKAEFPAESAQLNLRKFADKAWIYVDGKHYGNTERNRNLPVTIPPGELGILVENQGQINTMGEPDDRLKGLSDVSIYRREQFYWEIYPLPMDDLSKLEFGPYLKNPQGPCFHRAKFRIETPADTYVRIPYGMHGQVFLNGFNLGRYRVEGPQFALYAPAPLLKKGENELIIFETDGLRENKAEFIDYSDHAPAMEMVR